MMESIGNTNLTEFYMRKKMMDTQIGVMSAARSKSNAIGPQSPSRSSGGLRHMDPATDYKVRRVTGLVNEAIYYAANEPSLGYYRIQEHVHRTLPSLVQTKKELKENAEKIEEINYDMGLSVNVVGNISKISHFTRIQAALSTAIQHKKNLNILEEQVKARQEQDNRLARQANRSLSMNQIAEGYICPVCYFALKSQDELILHWQQEHNLQNYDNDVFQEVEIPTEQNEFVVNQMHDMTVIDVAPRISECEDVARSFVDCENIESEQSDSNMSGNVSSSNLSQEDNITDHNVDNSFRTES